MAILQKKAPAGSLISIIIVNYHTNKLVYELVKQLTPNGDNGAFEIIVIDNSKENKLGKKLSSFSHVRYYFLGKNVGFAAANNIGIKKARGEWVLLLNSDTVTGVEEIRELQSSCEELGYKVGAPKLVSRDRTTQDSVGYFDKVQKNLLNWLFVRPRLLHNSTINSPTPVDVATGAALLINKTIFNKIGFFDEKNFFMYFEDIDFCYRLYKNKIPILYNPKVSIVHYGGESSDKNPAQKNVNYTTARNAYIKKHRGRVILFINKIFKFFN